MDQLYQAAAKFGLQVGEQDIEEHLSKLPKEIHSQIRRLSKIYRLSERGIGGEQKNAKHLMDKLGGDFKDTIIQLCKNTSYQKYSSGEWTSDKGVNDVVVVPLGEGSRINASACIFFFSFSK